MSKVDSQAEWLESLMRHNEHMSDSPANAEEWEVYELCRQVKELQQRLETF
ncbi:hypothetical protein [Pantoea phage Nufs112]|nr:hypothetical protein [Pantoea phage Nufs112]